MSAPTVSRVAWACGYRFAIYRHLKEDGVEWFAIHDADTVSDAEVKAGIRPRRVRIESTLDAAKNYCDRQNNP